MRAALLGLLLACAHAAPAAAPAPEPAAEGPSQAEVERYALAHLLTDACTDEPTTEDRIAVVDFVLRTCRASPASCLRKACRTLAREACPKRYTLEASWSR